MWVFSELRDTPLPFVLWTLVASIGFPSSGLFCVQGRGRTSGVLNILLSLVWLDFGCLFVFTHSTIEKWLSETLFVSNHYFNDLESGHKLRLFICVDTYKDNIKRYRIHLRQYSARLYSFISLISSFSSVSFYFILYIDRIYHLFPFWFRLSQSTKNKQIRDFDSQQLKAIHI